MIEELKKEKAHLFAERAAGPSTLCSAAAVRLAGALDEATDDDRLTLDHYTTPPAAEKLVASHPLLCAKLHKAMALRILEAAKSRCYAAVLDHPRLVRNLSSTEGEP